METDLFGQEMAPTRFTHDEVDHILDIVPGEFLNDINGCLAALRKENEWHSVRHASGEQASSQSDNAGFDFGLEFTPSNQKGFTDAKKEFFLCVDWVFDLAETPAALPFEQACLHEAMDPEFIRMNIAKAFSKEIREFFFAYVDFCEKHLFNDHLRVKRKLREYILIEH